MWLPGIPSVALLGYKLDMVSYQTSEFLTLNLGFHDFTDVILLIN